jgi:DNA-binding IclR family transcriptional regulator
MEAGRHIEVERTSDDRTWFIQAAPVRDRRGDIVGGVEIALDVTRHKRGEEAVHELQPEYHEAEARTEQDDPASREG